MSSVSCARGYSLSCSLGQSKASESCKMHSFVVLPFWGAGEVECGSKVQNFLTVPEIFFSLKLATKKKAVSSGLQRQHSQCKLQQCTLLQTCKLRSEKGMYVSSILFAVGLVGKGPL